MRWHKLHKLLQSIYIYIYIEHWDIKSYMLLMSGSLLFVHLNLKVVKILILV